MLTTLATARSRTPDAVALRELSPDGAPVETSWAALHAAASRAAARAARLPTGSPVVLVVDGTAASAATLLGVTAAGVDVLVVESQSSHLDDARSPVHQVPAAAVVGPPERSSAGPAPYVPYEAFRAEPEDGTTTRSAPPAAAGEVWQLTSGSTGVPRIARQPLDSVLEGGRAYRALFGVTARDVVLVSVPLPHSYGLAGLYCGLVAQATVVSMPRFGIGPLVRSLRRDATVLLGTPLTYRLLATALAGHDPPSRLRVALSAGGPLPEDTADAVRHACGTPVRQIYGTTEAGLIACVPADRDRWPAGSVGRPAPGVTLRLHPETGRAQVHTRMMFRGYWGSEAPALTPDGFYDTGDEASVDAAGDVYLRGRRDSVVNVGGRKVSPPRVEQVLSAHPGVAEACVFGVERADGEQELHAAVALTAGTGAEEVLAHCRAEALQPYEVPHRLHTVDRLPRTGMGKVDRQALRASVRPANRQSTK